MKKLLWVGDAVAATGFAKVTHSVLEEVHHEWDVIVLGLNYYGEPHRYPYKIFPCVDPYRNARHPFGMDRIGEMIQYESPDLIVVQNDSWNIKPYLNLKGDVPMVGVIPVDGKNVRGRDLNGLRKAIFWTEFGLQECHRGGYQGESEAIPLGVDTDVYSPMDISKSGLRKQLALPERLHDSFIVGNVNRNQPRKRLDLTISFFCEWVKEYGVEDAYLYLHAAPTGEFEYDVSQLMEYYGLSSHLITFVPNVGHGIPENRMPFVYNTFDIQVTTTQGEGWGLTTLEGMACGIPQVVPDWSALGEWTLPSARVPVSEIACTMNRINIIGGVPDRAQFIAKMNDLYNSKDQRILDSIGGRGIAVEDDFRWKNIGKRYLNAFNKVFETPTVM